MRLLPQGTDYVMQHFSDANNIVILIMLSTEYCTYKSIKRSQLSWLLSTTYVLAYTTQPKA
jgi:hypothetical protein